MIKIKNLEVTNFKSLKDTKIDQFGKINLFYGFNNCGKSNIFKFLKLLFERKKVGTKVKYNPNEEGDVATTKSSVRIRTTNFWNGMIWNEPFLFTNNIRENPITFKIGLEIDNKSLPKSQELEKAGFLSKESTELLFSGQIVAIDHETSEMRLLEAVLNGKRFYKLEDELSTFFEDVKDDVLNAQVGETILNSFDDLVLLIDSDRNFTTEISKDGIDSIDVKNFKNGLYELRLNAEKNDKFKSVVKFLSKFEFSEDAKKSLSSNIRSFPFKESSEVDFTKFDNEIEIMLSNENGRFPLKNYGTGIQQFLYILSRIAQNNSRIVIIEELELNLSQLYQVELLRFLIKAIPGFFDQLIFSSHSPFFTQKNSNLVDIIHHVRIGFTTDGGTSVDSHDDASFDDVTGESYFSLLYA